MSNCDAGSNGIPPNQTSAIGGIAPTDISNGVITITPVAQNGLVSSDTYILTPTNHDGILTWASSGGGFDKGYFRD